MIQYPLSFFAKASMAPGIQTLWKGESGGHSLSCAIPVEFDGPGGGLSPEDLFAQALTHCFLATFKVYVEKSKLGFSRVDAYTELIVDLSESNRPVMSDARLKVSICGATSQDRLRALADKALRSGFILNSVSTRLHLDLGFLDEVVS
jgi:organic hydroperoxide reductase OsmC/OhrA